MIDLSLKDQDHLMHTLRFARWALNHAADLDYDRKRLDTSRLHRHALAYCILAAGEFAGKVNKRDLERAIPQIIWSELVGMRNRLAHRPDSINLNIVWRVITDDFPLLISTLEPMLAAAQPPDPTGPADLAK